MSKDEVYGLILGVCFALDIAMLSPFVYIICSY